MNPASFGPRVISAGAFDTVLHLDGVRAGALYAANQRAVIRYVPLSGNGPGWDIDAKELAADLAAGMTVCFVQHPRTPENNTLSAATGHADAVVAIAYVAALCKTVGYVPQPGARPKVFLALDMEGVRTGAPDHAPAWVADVLATGWLAVLVYIGYASGLSSAQCDALVALASDPADVCFWCDAGPYGSRPKPSKGYAWKQRMESTVAGIGVDEDDVLDPTAVYGLAQGVTAFAAAPEDSFPAAGSGSGQVNS